MFIQIDNPPTTCTLSAEALGGKGYGLICMSQEGINVPPALILPTEWCGKYKANPAQVITLLTEQLPAIKDYFTAKFGYMPLLSVRSGARVSMPGMMDTILNVGLDTSTLAAWRKRLSILCANDSYRRLIEMYGSVVNGLDRSAFHKKTHITSLSYYKKAAGYEFPEADQQIICSILAVFQSWDNPRAKIYRDMHGISDTWGTGVVLQAMVFGNFNANSCTGVMFSRNPDTGAPGVVGEYLNNAQGEDVVAGTATPLPLPQMLEDNPTLYAQLIALATKLEVLNRDVQDIEFTVQDGKLYALQTRNAKRSAVAAVGIAMDLITEGLITKQEAFSRVSVRTLDLANQKILDPKFKEMPLYTGIPACSGIATGTVMLSSASAVAFKGKCILVSKETTPDDIAGMAAAEGVLTMTGGATSHAAVVARGMNRVCIVGLGVDITSFKEGDTLSIDGATGRVWAGTVPVVDGTSSPTLKDFRNLLRTSASSGRILEVGDVVAANSYISLATLQNQPVDAVISTIEAAALLTDTLIIDFKLVNNREEAEFFSCFPQYFKQWLDKIIAFLDTANYPGVTVVNAPIAGLNTVSLQSNVSLSTMITTTSLVSLSTGEYETEAYAKVFKWREQDGNPVKLVTFGKVHPKAVCSYLSESQAAHELLKSA